MAGYTCDVHPGVPGSLLITNLDNGDTAVLCQDDILDWALAIASTFAPGDSVAAVVPPELAARLAEAVDAVPADTEAGDSGSVEDGPIHSTPEQAAADAAELATVHQLQDHAGAPEPAPVEP